MNENYDIVFTRSNAIDPDPRVEKAAKILKLNGYRCMALGWHRLTHEICRDNRDIIIKRMILKGKFGSGIKNFFGLIFFNFWLMFNLLIIRPKVIHTYDLDTVFPALLCRMFLKNKIVYDIADWFADSRKVGCLKGLFTGIERWVCGKVDLVVLAHELRIKQIGFEPKNWIVTYNTPEDFGILKNRNFEYAKETNQYFVYVGVLQPDRGIDQLIKVSLELGVNLIIAGFGPLEEMFSSGIIEGSTVVFKGRIPYEEALHLQKDAIAIMALYDPSIPNNKYAAPNKLFEAMMLRRPIITTAGTLTGDIVELEGIGIATPYGDLKRLAENMKFLLLNPNVCNNMGKKGRLLYEQKYTYSNQSRILIQAYSRILKNR